MWLIAIVNPELRSLFGRSATIPLIISHVISASKNHKSVLGIYGIDCTWYGGGSGLAGQLGRDRLGGPLRGALDAVVREGGSESEELDGRNAGGSGLGGHGFSNR